MEPSGPRMRGHCSPRLGMQPGVLFGLAAKTCAQWVAKQRRARAVLRPFKALRLQGAYLLPWTLRSYLLDLMEEAGMKRLQFGSCGRVEVPDHEPGHEWCPSTSRR